MALSRAGLLQMPDFSDPPPALSRAGVIPAGPTEVQIAPGAGGPRSADNSAREPRREAMAPGSFCPGKLSQAPCAAQHAHYRSASRRIWPHLLRLKATARDTKNPPPSHPPIAAPARRRGARALSGLLTRDRPNSASKYGCRFGRLAHLLGQRFVFRRSVLSTPSSRSGFWRRKPP